VSKVLVPLERAATALKKVFWFFLQKTTPWFSAGAARAAKVFFAAAGISTAF
jgi:hypothetical protein